MKSEKKQEIVYGIHPILELLKAKKRKIYSIYTTKPEPKAWQNILKFLPKYVKINYVVKEMLSKIASNTDHQSVVAFAEPLQIRKKFFNPQKEPFLIMLDGIQDPRNLGAILRSAYCAGVSGVVITQKSSTPISAVVSKSSAGLIEYLEIYLAPNAKHAAEELKKAGYSIYLATAPTSKQKSISPINCDFKLPVCVVIGGEGFGISKEILDSGQHITLPQKDSQVSYNASVAAGILLFLISTKNNII